MAHLLTQAQPVPAPEAPKPSPVATLRTKAAVAHGTSMASVVTGSGIEFPAVTALCGRSGEASLPKAARRRRCGGTGPHTCRQPVRWRERRWAAAPSRSPPIPRRWWPRPPWHGSNPSHIGAGPDASPAPSGLMGGDGEETKRDSAKPAPPAAGQGTRRGPRRLPWQAAAPLARAPAPRPLRGPRHPSPGFPKSRALAPLARSAALALAQAPPPAWRHPYAHGAPPRPSMARSQAGGLLTRRRDVGSASAWREHAPSGHSDSISDTFAFAQQRKTTEAHPQPEVGGTPQPERRDMQESTERTAASAGANHGPSLVSSWARRRPHRALPPTAGRPQGSACDPQHARQGNHASAATSTLARV